MERRNLAPTLLDGLTADLGGVKSMAFFERANTLIPWDQMAAAVADLAPAQPQGGRPFWPLVTMLKCVMLQKWYGLSDPGLEETLRDRLSFRRFVGLSLADATPDATTLCVFRQRLREHQHGARLFDTVLDYLKQKGVVVQAGTLIDATIVDAPQGEKRADGSSTKDPCATYTKNHGTLRHGYKAHLATTTQGIITDYVFDTAKVHDSRHADQLLRDEPVAAYADSAYRDKDRIAALEARGVKARIVHKRVRGQAELTPEQKRHNRACSRVRAMVEHPRAWMMAMGYVKVRYRGLVRNALDFVLTAVAYNLKRSFSLRGYPLTEPRPDRCVGVRPRGLALA